VRSGLGGVGLNGFERESVGVLRKVEDREVESY